MISHSSIAPHLTGARRTGGKETTQPTSPYPKETISHVSQLNESNIDSCAIEQEQDISTDVSPLESANGEFQRLEIFANGAEVAAMFDEDMLSGKKQLTPWQIRANEILATEATIKDPLQFALVAANGSGKDSYVIACSVIWFALRYIKANIVITSASGVQLTNQTETYIRDLANRINLKFGEKWFKINQRNIKCHKTGSVIRMFATDEPGKAEGYHPFPNSDGICFLVLNEAKSIPEEIILATKRCSPSHLLYISSAGENKGSFYKAFCTWEHTMKVTSYDCPFKSPKVIEQDKLELGEHSFWFRSKHLSEFTSVDATVVITQESVNRCIETCKTHQHTSWPKRVGLDLSVGGDESVICITHGNKRTYQYTFRERDTIKSAEIISTKLAEQGISKDSEHIYADNGGVGVGIIDNLRRLGWNIKRVHNQWAAHNKKDFGNVGAEMWFILARLIDKCCLILPEDDRKFMGQLTSRHYKQMNKGQTVLIPKAEEKAQGQDSPDRVDAFVLSLRGLTLKDFLGEKLEATQRIDSTAISQEQIIKDHMDNIRYAELDTKMPDRTPISYANEELLEGTNYRKPSIVQLNRTSHSAYSLSDCLGL